MRDREHVSLIIHKKLIEINYLVCYVYCGSG